MNSIKQLLMGIIGIAFIILFSVSCQKEDEQEYTGTLTVLQKDAYSDVAGRSLDLWPPHTTTVFKWDKGTEVQLNHGTAPDEKDSQGNLFLVATKVYEFSGTQSEIEALQKTYKEAVCDDASDKVLDMSEAKGVLVKSFLDGLVDYLLDDENNFICNGTVTVPKVIAHLRRGEISQVVTELENCGWGQAKWSLVFETVLGDVVNDLGHNLSDYHVCNNDAALQVDLIKNFITTGKVEMPEKNCSGPMMYYTPN